MNLKSKQEKIVSVCIIIMVFVAVSFVCRPVFYLNDDVTMRSILSGSYSGSPDGHAVYMKYPLTWVLSLLYSMTKVIPWLEIFFAGCLIWSAVECSSKFKNEKWGMWGALIPAVLFALSFFCYMHYTMIAAVLAGTAAICLCCGESKVKPVVFWLLAWMIRSQVAYLALPFLGVAFLWKMVSAQRDKVRNELVWSAKTCVMILAGLLVCAGINSLAYRSEKWQDYLYYNEVRTQLYDYTDFHSTDVYGQNYEQYGMTKEEFLILDSYNTMLDQAVDGEKIGMVAEKVTAGMHGGNSFAQQIKECVLKYYYEMRYSNHMYVYAWAAVLVVLMGILLLEKKWLQAALVVCLEAGRSMIWMYLIYRGRFPERVVVSLYVIEIMLLTGLLVGVTSVNKGKVYKAAQIALAAILSLILFVQVGMDAQRTQAQSRIQKEWTILTEYCEKDPENLYLIDVFSAVEYGGVQYQQDAANMMLAGGWMSDSPLATDRFHKMNAADGGQALFENENVLFVTEEGSDIAWLEEYLEGRFGTCTLQQADELVCGENKVFQIWKVTK